MTHGPHKHGGHGHGGAGSDGSHSGGDGGHSGPIHDQSAKLLSSPADLHHGSDRLHNTDHVIVTPMHTETTMRGRQSIDIPPPDMYMRAAAEMPQKSREGKINGATSVGDLLKQTGDKAVFVDKQSDANDKLQEKNVLKQGETPKISVVYENKNPSADPPPPPPDFVVKKDGTIEVMHNPEKNPNANIVVQVERDNGQTGDPTDQQKESLKGLVPYLSDRVANNPDYQKLAGGKVSIDDQQNLLPDEVKQNIENNINKPPKPDQTQPPVPDVPPEANNVSGRMNRVGGSGGGTESFSGNGDGAVPSRDGLQPTRDTTPPVQAVEDTVSALSGIKDKQHPYENVSSRSDGSYGVGRYAMNYFAIGSWLGDLFGVDLGDPPDPAKLAALLAELKKNPDKLHKAMDKMAKDHKIPQAFADKFQNKDFANHFVDFVDKLQGKNGPVTSKDVHDFMPRELQEVAAKNRIETYAKNMNIDTAKMGDKDPGKLALAMFLGRTPSQSDLSNPNYQQYQDTANNMYKLALAGQFGSDRIDVSEINGKVVALANSDVGKQLWAQTPWAASCQGGNLGCAASVSKVLQEAGLLRQGEGSAGVLDLASQLRSKHGYQQIQITDKSQFRPGDIVYGSNGGSDQHIGIIGEVAGGQVWEYDNSSSKTTWQHRTLEQGGSFVPGGRFGRNHLYVLRAPGSTDNSNAA